MLRPTLSRAINRSRLGFGCDKNIFLFACIVFLFSAWRVFHLTHLVTSSGVAGCIAFSAITKGAGALTKSDQKLSCVPRTPPEASALCCRAR